MISEVIYFIVCAFSNLTYVSAIVFVLLLIGLHFMSKFFKRPKPLNLNPDSVVIITGGCMGIGKIMAIQIARLYHPTIIIVDRRKDLFESVSEQIKQQNAICQCYYCDLADNKSVDNFIQNIKDTHKKIDLFLYNAGVFIPSKGWQVKDGDHDLIMKVNYFTPIRMIREFFPLLEGNHIAIVGSMTSIMNGAKQLAAYMASKHAIFGYVHCLRQDLLAEKNPTTVSIGCPYAINTTMFQGVKTKLDKIMPILDEKYVGKRLVKEFVNKKEVCFIQRRHAIVINLVKFLPTFVNDWIQVQLDESMFPKQAAKSQKDE